MTSTINALMVDCRPELEDAYNEWYDKTHIPLCLKYRGMLRANRYRLLKGPSGQSRYLTIYEFCDKEAMDAFPDSPECKTAIEEMKQRWKDNDFEIKWTAQYETIGGFQSQ